MNSRRLLALLLLASMPPSIGIAEAAQTVYRCGNTYSYVGCVNGAAVAGTSPVSAGDRNEAERIASRQRKLGLDMEGDRRREEASVKPAKAGSFKAADAAHPAASAPHRRGAKKRRPGRDLNVAGADETFVARVPTTLKQK